MVALGGALGSVSRWALGQAVGGPAVGGHGEGFPWATFLENVSGGFALGMLMVLAGEKRSQSRYLRPFLGVGVLGGFTTWSAYMLDTRSLVVADDSPLAAVYLFGTLVAGLAAVRAGLMIARGIAEPGDGRGDEGRSS